MKGMIVIALIGLTLSLFNATYANEVVHGAVGTYLTDKKVSSNQTDQILTYINIKLREAGFSEETREYILNISKQQIAASGKSPTFDQELIDKNIYMLIENLKIKDQKSSSLISKQIYQASTYAKPWAYLIDTNRFEYFNSHSVFNDVTPLAIQEAIKKICPIFPFCQSPAKPKKKR